MHLLQERNPITIGTRSPDGSWPEGSDLFPFPKLRPRLARLAQDGWLAISRSGSTSEVSVTYGQYTLELARKWSLDIETRESAKEAATA